ncbi:uncharacterized protein [Atheta coriaria]
MYRSDKQFMKNPATASSRIYVGNLTDNIKPEDLDQKFSQYGRILGLVVQRGFGFVQFESDEQAQLAIMKEHGNMFYGKKMNVKQAIDNTNKTKPGGNNLPPNRNQQNNSLGNQNQFNQQQQNQGMNQSPNMNMNQNQASNMNQMNNFQNQGNQQQANNFPNTFQSNQANLQNKMNPNQNQNQNQNNKPDTFQKNEMHSPNKPPQPPSIKPLQVSDSYHPNQNKGMDNQNMNQSQNQQMSTNVNLGNMGMNDESHKRKRLRNRGSGGGLGGPGLNRDFRGDRGDYMDDMDSMYYDPPYGHGMGPGPDFPHGPGGHMNAGPRMGPDIGHGIGMGRGGMAMGSDRMGPDSYHGMPPVEKPERNDCEIIVVAKALTEYAEYIEHRLKELGLIVDLLFPNDDVPIGRVLANISSRGCLFAILIMPQNEDHRSLTLNILHGIPEEHRNMPIEDALLLITRNFDAYMRGEKATVEKDKMSVSSKHPEHVQIIVNLLAENRQIASHYYDKLIAYLQEKRDLQYKYEIAEGLESGIEPETKNKQAELQNRIMNILNKKMDEPAQPESEAVSAKEEPAPLLTDPSVQKALDSLILGDMFKNLVQ